MTHEPSVTFQVVQAMARGVTRYGISTDQFYANLGLPSDPAPDTRTSMFRLAEQLDLIAARKGAPQIALELSRSLPVGALGPCDYEWSASSTLFEAMLRTHREIERITDGLDFEMRIEGPNAIIAHRYHMDRYPAVLAEHTTAAVALRIQHVLGSDVKFTAVTFTHSARGQREAYEAFFGVPVQFDADESLLVFPAALLQAPLLTADPDLVRLLRERAHSAKSKPEPLLDRARAILRTALDRGEGPLSLAEVAGRLTISTRSFQRRLAEHATTFSTLLDDARRDLATSLLEREGILLADVAARLGFGDPSAFHRAFRRWTGVAPGAFRSALSKRS